MRFFLIVIFCITFNCYCKAQNNINTDTIGAKTVSDHVYNKMLFTDSLTSSFAIVIKKEVKAHKHLTHAEHVVVLEGTAQMKLGDKRFEIKKGDVIFIPKNTIHSVKNTGKIPLKVLSFQAPYFDGKDRVFID